MTENNLAIRETNLMPAMSLNEAKHRYNVLVEYTKEMMTEGKDYGVIPGTGDKPTLLKPGAEKLCSLFGLYPEFETVDHITDFEKGLFYFREKCTLYRNGEPVASGVGSCNNMEKKYRYRYVYENKATEEEKETAVSVETKNGRYGAYKVYKVENSEPFDLVNTIDKMAQKRALVAATLIGANASEFYTQDIEDLDIVDGDFQEVQQPKPQPKPQRKATPKPKPEPANPDEPMTIEKAMTVESSQGEKYGDLPVDKLSYMFNAIEKALKENGLDADKKATYEMKRSAIKVLLQAHQDGSI